MVNIIPKFIENTLISLYNNRSTTTKFAENEAHNIAICKNQNSTSTSNKTTQLFLYSETQAETLTSLVRNATVTMNM